MPARQQDPSAKASGVADSIGTTLSENFDAAVTFTKGACLAADSTRRDGKLPRYAGHG